MYSQVNRFFPLKGVPPLRREAKEKVAELIPFKNIPIHLNMFDTLTLLHSERPKLHRVLAIVSAVGLILF